MAAPNPGNGQQPAAKAPDMGQAARDAAPHWLALNSAMSGVTNVLKGFGAAMAGIAAIGPATLATLGGIGGALGVFVSKANPAVFEQFTLALNDTLAVIGQGLAPVLQVVTEMMRMFGDTLAVFSRDVGGALAVILQSLMPVFEVFLEAFAQVGTLVADVLKQVAPAIRFIMEGIRDVFNWIGDKVKWLLSLVGVELSSPDIKRGASAGAATRSASIGSVADLVSKAQTSAFSLGNASSSVPEWTKSTATNTFKMSQTLTDILATLKNPLRVIDMIEEARQTNKDIERLKADIANNNTELARIKQARAGASLATNAALNAFGLAPLYSQSRVSLGDGGGTVSASQ